MKRNTVMYPRFHRSILLGGLLLAGVAGCPEPDGRSEPWIGLWRLYDATGALELEMSLSEDGTFELEYGGSPEEGLAGTYSATDTMLSWDARTSDGERMRASFSYYVNHEMLFLNVLTPIGDNDGIVGTWEGIRESRYDEAVSRESIVMELRADGTIGISETSALGQLEVEGTYLELSPDHFEVTFELPAGPDGSSGSATIYVTLVDGRCLSSDTFLSAALLREH